MKNKFYASLLIGIGLTLASVPSLAKTAQPSSAKKQTTSSKSTKTNSQSAANSKKPAQTIAKKSSPSTTSKQKSNPVANTTNNKHSKSHQIAETKDSKHSQAKSHQLTDAKDSKHGKSKSHQLTDAKDSKHSKAKLHQLADAKNSKHSKAKSHQQLANAKHSRRKSDQAVEEVYENEEDTTVAEGEELEQSAEDTNTEQSTEEIASQVTDTDYSDENTGKTNELVATPPKSSQLFFQPLDKNSAQTLIGNHNKPSDVVSTQNDSHTPKTMLSFSGPTKANSQIANNERVHSLIGNGKIASSVAEENDAEDDEESPLSPSTPIERSNHLIQPSQNNKRVHSSIIRGDNNFIDNSTNQETNGSVASAHSVVESSLAEAGAKAGLSEDMIVELTEIFAWDIDFANNLQAGDQFTIVYEQGGGKAHNKIIAAEFVNRGKAYTAIRYKDQEGVVSYYTPEGRSTRKAFLITPVDFAKVSSHFSTHRRHPILNRIRAHKGVDYAARTGTPVKAAGDGIIKFHGNQGGYGRMIVISHGDHYETAYAHLSNFRKNLQDGEQVKQGEVIGYVGQSGLATGPHLHYEFRVDGVHRDPENLDSKQAMHLANEEWDNFHDQTVPVLKRLYKARPDTFVAKNP